MVRSGCPVTKRSQLRGVDVEYVDLQGTVKRGHVVVNADTAARIFTRLRKVNFPIRQMQGVEQYGGDTLKSLRPTTPRGITVGAWIISMRQCKSRHTHRQSHRRVNPRENRWMDLRCKMLVAKLEARTITAATAAEPGQDSAHPAPDGDDQQDEEGR